ncbi:dihydrofolate synthase/folylpolyglutamate synthase [Kineosphaera limosa]|uniref:tetrahydrofolate synthase n=1 Tax=Kineosphaera limosa NBRC 100340 TaxID=1184609 RepID=K6WSR3_9MICO|nr:folylpolyglutamate synthase/dihydrofolate synthase family protein [Kineosphaera limosa]NYE02772.1 dihydrofolate synthase/folylpolyglutamate synthase [Kineosphaera limosa]GAB96851.1 folylpolyglutamate synthase [Kineosphaera limosa NBRC 100340]
MDLSVRKRLREVEEEIVSRAPEHDIDPTLARTQALLELLGDPQSTFPLVHITGTNGKTTMARMVERLLLELNLRTGRFTSPHLHDIRERIVLSGEPISGERFVDTYDEVAPLLALTEERCVADGLGRFSFFEVLVVMAYAAFADAPVDVAVVEVGMGGQWDATNVADASVAVIGPIGLDHERYLGSELEDIAGEKAGIIKPGALVLSAAQDLGVAELLRERCAEVGAALVFDTTASGEGGGPAVLARDVAIGGQQVSLRGLAADYPDLFLPLHGVHQAHNALLALCAVEAFVGGGEQPLEQEVVRAAFAAFDSPGRLEIVRRSPTVLVDAAHNPAGVRSLIAALVDSFVFGRTIGVFACMADKDADGMLELLEPVFDEIVITRTTSMRAMDPERLGALATEFFGEHRVHVVRDLPDALDRAGELADEEGVGGGVVATGSVFIAAEVRMLLGKTS